MPPASNGRVAYVDVRRAVSQIAEGRKALDIIRAWMEGNQRSLDAERQRIEAKMKEYQTKESGLADPEKRALQQELLQLRTQFNERAQKLQQELEQRQSKAIAEVGKKLELVVARLAEERRYSAIAAIERDTVLFVARDSEVTDEIIRRYDAEHAPARNLAATSGSNPTPATPTGTLR